jgi:hypothetical protein
MAEQEPDRIGDNFADCVGRRANTCRSRGSFVPLMERRMLGFPAGNLINGSLVARCRGLLDPCVPLSQIRENSGVTLVSIVITVTVCLHLVNSA